MLRGVVMEPNWSRPPIAPITGTFLTSKPFILRRLLPDREWARPSLFVGVGEPIRAFTAARPPFPMALKILLKDPELSLFLAEASGAAVTRCRVVPKRTPKDMITVL